MSKESAKLLGGLAAAILAGLGALSAGLPSDACWTAAITTLTAIYWVTEAVPIPAASLIPLAAFPLTGVLDRTDAARAYGHPLILLLLGGFILSKSVESSGAHKRLAIGMVRAFGGFGRRGLVLGFMAATALSSMWISNTATVLMMLPIALAIITEDEDRELELALLLGIAYAASIGGVGTPIGTPPNVVFMGAYEEASGQSVSFLQWMSWGLPVTAAFVPATWLILTRRMRAGALPKLPTLGAWQPAEKRVIAIFALTAAAWIFRSNPAGGWTALLGLGAWNGETWRATVGDETVALAAVAIMFVTPNGAGGRMLTWEKAVEIPWGLLLLFGGGLSIAAAFGRSGLSDTLGDALKSVAAAPELLVIGVICLSVTFITELTSNTATTTLLMPILFAAAHKADVDPKTLMVPAAISASCAFMMPVATAPNAVVFGTERIPIRTMVRTGVWLNLVGALLITVVCAVLL